MAWMIWTIEVECHDDPTGDRQLVVTAHGGTAERLSRRFAVLRVSQAMIEPFLSPGLRDWLTLAGGIAAILTVVGVALSYARIKQAKKSADEAEKAAKKAILRVEQFTGVATLEQLCSRSRDLLQICRSSNLKAAAMAAFELRESVAKFSSSPSGKALVLESKWQSLLKEIARIHDLLESSALINKIDKGQKEKCIHQITQIHATLTMFSGAALEWVGG